MFSFKNCILFLAFFIALVSTHPIHPHHRRGTCKPRSSSASPEIVSLAPPAPTPLSESVAVPSSSLPVISSSSITAAPSPVATGSSSSVSSEGGPKPTSEPVPEPSSQTSSEASSVSTSSPAKPSETGSSGPKNPSETPGGLLALLFPVSSRIESWTTSPSNGAARLSDATFRPTKVLKAAAYQYANAPDGKEAMKLHFPQGSYTYNQPVGGVSFYAPGPASVDLTTAKEATLGYSIFFPEGYDFVKGGKLPGLYGGNSDDESTGCSGGRRDAACFSARLMWRATGQGELYTYLDPTSPANQAVCNVPPFSECNPTYGASVGRGSFTFPTGQWTTVSQRVRLNDVGQENGELELFVNGKSVVNVGGLVLRNSDAGRIRGIQMQAFFGGHSRDYASTKDQDLYFSDFSAAITEKL